MSAQTVRSTGRPAGTIQWLLLVCAGSAALVARPVFGTPAMLAAFYVVLAGVSRAGNATAGSARLAPFGVFAAGAAVLVSTRLLPGTAIPARAGTAAIFLSTLAAIAEEAFFRRLVYGKLSERSVALAVTGSAVAFAALHVPAYGIAAFPVDLGAGFLLSWQRWASGRWEVPAATHALANLLAMIR